MSGRLARRTISDMTIPVIGATGEIGFEGSRPPAQGRSRGDRRISVHRRQPCHRPGSGRSAVGRGRACRCREFAVFRDGPVMDFFTASTQKSGGCGPRRRGEPLSRAVHGGLRHAADSGYMRAKGGTRRKHRRVRAAVHRRSRDPLSGVRRGDRPIADRRRQGASAGRTGASSSGYEPYFRRLLRAGFSARTCMSRAMPSRRTCSPGAPTADGGTRQFVIWRSRTRHAPDAVTRPGCATVQP